MGDTDKTKGDKTAIPGSTNTANRRCARCKNHVAEPVPLKGHKRYCKWRHCVCESCIRTAMRQKATAQKTARSREQQEDAKRAKLGLDTAIPPPPPIITSNRRDGVSWDSIIELMNAFGYNVNTPELLLLILKYINSNVQDARNIILGAREELKRIPNGLLNLNRNLALKQYQEQQDHAKQADGASAPAVVPTPSGLLDLSHQGAYPPSQLLCARSEPPTQPNIFFFPAYRNDFNLWNQTISYDHQPFLENGESFKRQVAEDISQDTLKGSSPIQGPKTNKFQEGERNKRPQIQESEGNIKRMRLSPLHQFSKVPSKLQEETVYKKSTEEVSRPEKECHRVVATSNHPTTLVKEGEEIYTRSVIEEVDTTNFLRKIIDSPAEVTSVTQINQVTKDRGAFLSNLDYNNYN